jgi:hypothetical protein
MAAGTLFAVGRGGCSFHEGLRVRAVLDLSAGHAPDAPGR